jgi:tetratricopeptide (TPR) repeat protein
VTRLEGCEAATLGPVHHPHIVPIYSVRKAAGGVTVVCMPYRGAATLHHLFDRLHGGAETPSAAALFDACRDEALADVAPAPRLLKGDYVDRVRLVAAQLAEALAHLHARGACHRDLKPSNILLQPDGAPLLLDFNLSSNARSTDAPLGGTPSYMAPEQLQAFEDKDGAGLDGKADVFALGVILYEWLTGKLPFGPMPAKLDTPAQRQQVRARHRQGPRPFDDAEVDAELAALVRRCLALDPGARPSAAELGRRLRGQMSLPRRALRHVRRHPRPWVAGLAAAVALLAVAAVFAVTRPSPDARAYERGREAYREQRWNEAVEYLSAAILLKPDEPSYRFARGAVYQQLGETDKKYFASAMNDFHAAEKLAPEARYAAGLGYCAQKQSQGEVVAYYYEKALAGGFTSAAVHNNVGVCYEIRDPAKAQRHFESALALDAELLQAHWNLALLHFRAGLTLLPVKDQPANLAVFQERVRAAQRHVQTTLRLASAPPADLLHQAALIHALAMQLDPANGQIALEMCERAVAAGYDPKKLRDNAFLAPLRNEPRFLALAAPSPAPPRARLARILDPLAPVLP